MRSTQHDKRPTLKSIITFINFNLLGPVNFSVLHKCALCCTEIAWLFPWWENVYNKMSCFPCDVVTLHLKQAGFHFSNHPRDDFTSKTTPWEGNTSATTWQRGFHFWNYHPVRCFTLGDVLKLEGTPAPEVTGFQLSCCIEVFLMQLCDDVRTTLGHKYYVCVPKPPTCVQNLPLGYQKTPK